jgi:DNA-directed RNA polymerase subunit RPC12/RpoP
LTEKPNNKEPRHSYAPEAACDACPHCGHKLSPWQQVLLTVDRALVCKNCWYRIILGIVEDGPKDSSSPNEE